MKKSKISSPCIGRCVLEKDVCKSCNRSVYQITNWTKYTEAQREQATKKLERATFEEACLNVYLEYDKGEIKDMTIATQAAWEEGKKLLLEKSQT